tara:strand:+ start:585 stop:1505 length:921 start_codon:yes stop_codon:yes gene_type:complete
MSEIKFSKFMKTLVEHLEKKGLSDNTVKSYIHRLYIVNDKNKFTSLKFLKDHEIIISKLKERLTPSTQKSYAGTICSVLSLKPTKANEKLKKIYNSFISDEDIQKIQNPKTKPESWMEKDEILKIKNDLTAQAEMFYKNDTLGSLQYNVLLKNALLSFYVNLPPRRSSDYALMKYQNDTEDKKFNYLTTNNKLLFNNYKTDKTYGTQEVNISSNKALLKDIKMYLKHRVEHEDNMLFVKQNGKAFNAINDITRTLNAIFKKNISTTVLRKMYVTHKYGALKEEMLQDSEAMGHSVTMQQTHYNKGS